MLQALPTGCTGQPVATVTTVAGRAGEGFDHLDHGNMKLASAVMVWELEGSIDDLCLSRITK